MTIFEQAMKLEKEGETLYRQFEKDSSDTGRKTIFSWLAEQEKKHYEILETMNNNTPVSKYKSPVLRGITAIFKDWKKNPVALDTKATQADLYRRALAVEINSVSFYEKCAGEAKEAHKVIFLRLAQEEKKHQTIMENIIEFITKPDVWVENAEFNHLEEDYYL